MRKTIFLFTIILLLAQISKAQDTTKNNQFYNKNFNWRITIPEKFDTVSAEAWAKIKNKGQDAIEKTYKQKIKDQTKTIFVFRSDPYNYFEANYQPFDTKKDGSYLKLNQTVDAVIYHTLKTQIPDATIDSATTTITIDKLNFNVFILRAMLPNNLVFSIYSFSRLFGNKDFTVSIIFLNTAKGDIMLDAWKSSTFGK